MTPQLQQAIHLLQLPILELQAQIHEALESNVMLESEEDSRDDANGSDTSTTAEVVTGDESWLRPEMPASRGPQSSFDPLPILAAGALQSAQVGVPSHFHHFGNRKRKLEEVFRRNDRDALGKLPGRKGRHISSLQPDGSPGRVPGLFACDENLGPENPASASFLIIHRQTMPDL